MKYIKLILEKCNNRAILHHGNKALWAVRKAQETFLEELEEGKIRVVPENEFYEAMKTENINFSA